MSKQYNQYEINETFCPTTQTNGREMGIKQNQKYQTAQNSIKRNNGRTRAKERKNISKRRKGKGKETPKLRRREMRDYVPQK